MFLKCWSRGCPYINLWEPLRLSGPGLLWAQLAKGFIWNMSDPDCLSKRDNLIRSGVAQCTARHTYMDICLKASTWTGVSRLRYIILACKLPFLAVLNITSKIHFLENRIWTLDTENRVLENRAWTVGKAVVCASVFLPTVLCKWRNEEFCVDITLRYSLCNSDHSLYCHSIKSLENPVSSSCCCSAVPKFYHGKRTWCPLWQDLLDCGCVPLRMHL